MIEPRRIRIECLAWAAVAAGLALAWQYLTVIYNWHGDWSAMFYTGAPTSLPPELRFEEVYRFRGSAGFDGQYYHLVAHDPLMRRGFDRYVDNPRLRWRRILAPGLAWLFATGNDERVDFSFLSVNLAFVFLGAYWTGRFCGRGAYALLFPLVPAVLVSLDRSTIDTALAALAVGFAWYGTRRTSRWIWVVLPVAPLARETGLVLIMAWCVHSLLGRQWRATALGAAAGAPFLAWVFYVNQKTGHDLTVFASWLPLKGLLSRTLHPVQYPTGSAWLVKAAVLDYLAVLGIWAALLLTIRLVWKRSPGLVEIACALFAGIFVLFLSQPQAWAESYAFARTMSPLLIWLALLAVERRFWWNLAPLAFTIPRILFQLGPQWKGILQGLF